MTLIGNVITFFTLLMGAMVTVLVVGESRYGNRSGEAVVDCRAMVRYVLRVLRACGLQLLQRYKTLVAIG
jgi:hypothetical protein